jgi:cation diffusion facilitator family transporter
MKEKISLLGILVNSFFAAGKITVGIFSHSASILADGFHSLADIFSSFIGYLGIKKAQKPADEKHPYGHFKFEVLGGIVIVLFLLAAGVEAIFEAYQNYLDPQKIKLSYWTFAVMLISVAVNFTTSKLKIYYGKKENSLTLLTDGMHDKADVLASSAVLLGLFLSHYWVYADALLAFLIGLYIIKESFPIGKEAIDSLLDVSAGKEVEDRIKRLVREQDIDLASLKTQKKGSAITANLEINLKSSLTVEKANQISDDLRKKLMREIENLQYVIIQIRSHALETNFYQPTFGQGFGWQRKGKFKKELPKTEGKGPDGECVCPQCGYTIPHQKGVPCSSLQCPNCNINLERK